VDLVVALLQAFAVVLASALAQRIVRRIWRHQRAVRAAYRIVAEVEAEIAGLIARGEAEFSRRPRAAHALAVARLRDAYPHLTVHEAKDLILRAASSSYTAGKVG
jgi:hypothetical protein